MKPLFEQNVYEFPITAGILELESMPEAVILDLLFSADGIDPRILSNKDFLLKIQEYSNILDSESNPPQHWNYEGYTLADIEDCQFVKYYIHNKAYSTPEYTKKIQQGIKKHDYAPLLPILATWLDHTTDKQDEYDHAKRLERISDFAQKPALFALNCFNHINTQLNNLSELYPFYFANSDDGKKMSAYEAYYIENALDLQLEYMASINHCKIEDVLLMPISLVLKHISLSNQKHKIEQDIQKLKKLR